MLPTNIPEIKRDTKDSAFYYFKNGFVEVTKNNIQTHPYNKLDKVVWKKYIQCHTGKSNLTYYDLPQVNGNIAVAPPFPVKAFYSS